MKKLKYLIDTNICIYWLRDRNDIDKQIDAVGFEHCAISEITMAELKIGSILGRKIGLKDRHALDELFSKVKIIPISDAIDLFAEEKVRLRLAGTPMDDNFDLLIGCTAVVNNLIMVTENTKDFKNIKGIKLENWIDSKKKSSK